MERDGTKVTGHLLNQDTCSRFWALDSRERLAVGVAQERPTCASLPTVKGTRRIAFRPATQGEPPPREAMYVIYLASLKGDAS